MEWIPCGVSRCLLASGRTNSCTNQIQVTRTEETEEIHEDADRREKESDPEKIHKQILVTLHKVSFVNINALKKVELAISRNFW